jgi:hypothetical protein
MTMTAASQPAPHPVQIDVTYPENLSRLLIFVNWLLAIPHFIILYLLYYAVGLVTFIAFFTILFTRKYPEGLFKFSVGVYRWGLNVGAYAGLMRDEYPPFTLDAGKYPVEYEVAFPADLNRWLPLVKWLLAIPNMLVFLVIAVAAVFVQIAAFFAILFTGKYPRSWFDFSVGCMRWGQRLNAYIYLLRDEYPPFSLKP